MKKILALLVLVLAASKANAFSVPALTYQTMISSVTTVIVSVSSNSATGATQMDNPQLPGRVVMEIDNIDATANLWCLPVSTTPVANGGRKIAPGSTWVISVADGLISGGANPPVRTTVKFWCLSDASGSTSKAAVTQGY